MAVNATLPKDSDPQALTLEEALTLIADARPKAPAKKSGRAEDRRRSRSPRKERKRRPRRKACKAQARAGQPANKVPRKQKGKPTPPIDKARVLEALAARPGATKRDLSRLLNIKGSDRIALEAHPEGAGSRRLAGRQPQARLRPARRVARGRRAGNHRPGSRRRTARRARSTGRANEEPPQIVVVLGAKRSRTRRWGAATAFSRGCRKPATATRRASSSGWAPAPIACSASSACRAEACASRRSTARAAREFSVVRATARAPRTTSWCWPNRSRAAPAAFPARAWWSASAAWTRPRRSA